MKSIELKSTRDIENLAEQIREQLGIDLEKYKNEEAIEDFVDLLLFPSYAAKAIFLPLLCSLILFVLGYYFLQLVHIEFIIYSLLGFALYLLTGIFGGLYFLSSKIKADLGEILEYSLNIMSKAIEDMDNIQARFKPENKKELLGLLFKGVVHIVTIPILSETINEKVPFVGGLVSRMAKKSLDLMSQKAKFETEELSLKSSEELKDSAFVEMLSKPISIVSSGMGNLVALVFKIVQVPLKAGFGICLVVLLLFLYLLN